MPEATADDVRVEIDTRLSDSDIDGILARVERDWQREYESSAFEDTQHIADFEATLTAHRIATSRDRTTSDESLGNRSKTYDTSFVSQIEERIRALDPGDAFARGTFIRDSNRYSGRAGPNTET